MHYVVNSGITNHVTTERDCIYITKFPKVEYIRCKNHNHLSHQDFVPFGKTIVVGGGI